MLIPNSIRNLVVVIFGGFLVGLLTIATLNFFTYLRVSHYIVGNPKELVGLLLALGGFVLGYIAYIILVIQGVRTHWGWGVINIVVPIVAILFFIKHPKRTKAGMLIYVLALIFFVFAALWAKLR